MSCANWVRFVRVSGVNVKFGVLVLFGDARLLGSSGTLRKLPDDSSDCVSTCASV